MRRITTVVAAAVLAIGLPAFGAGTATGASGSPGCPSFGSVDTTTEPVETVPVGDSVSELPAWMTIEIVDVCGEPFTLADFVGRPVFVENFATWCHNCAEQLTDTEAAAAEVGADAVFVVLSVETDIDPDDVAEYAAERELLSMRFAVMTPELLAEMVDAFGNSAANPPSVPHLVIAADGTPGDLATGFESSEQIVAALHEAGAGTPVPAISIP